MAAHRDHHGSLLPALVAILSEVDNMYSLNEEQTKLKALLYGEVFSFTSLTGFSKSFMDELARIPYSMAAETAHYIIPVAYTESV